VRVFPGGYSRRKREVITIPITLKPIPPVMSNPIQFLSFLPPLPRYVFPWLEPNPRVSHARSRVIREMILGDPPTQFRANMNKNHDSRVTRGSLLLLPPTHPPTYPLSLSRRGRVRALPRQAERDRLGLASRRSHGGGLGLERRRRRRRQ